MTTTIITVIGAVVTALGGFFVAKLNTNSDRQKFYEDKITNYIATLERKIEQLEEEIKMLRSGQ